MPALSSPSAPSPWPVATSYIKRDEFDSTIADLRATDQKLQSQIDSLSQKHDALVTQLAGRVRVETGAHFATGDATLSDQDKPLLDDFARVIKDSHSDALITVEGFTDPAGSAATNRRLGLQRAQAVRDYLVSSGLGAEQVRAVSYGEDQNRQVRRRCRWRRRSRQPPRLARRRLRRRGTAERRARTPKAAAEAQPLTPLSPQRGEG